MDQPQETPASVPAEGSEQEQLPAARSTRESPDLPEPVFTPFSLTVGDGFKFGCGFMMAATIALLIALLVAAVVVLAASILNVPLPR